jgi:hypothetical protein
MRSINRIQHLGETGSIWKQSYADIKSGYIADYVI